LTLRPAYTPSPRVYASDAWYSRNTSSTADRETGLPRLDNTPGMNQEERAQLFRRLHHEPPILVLANAWDVGSARLVERLPGCRAIATSSASFAWALGYPDGERIPPEEMIELVARIAQAVSVPVTADLEAGYGDAASTAAAAWV